MSVLTYKRCEKERPRKSTSGPSLVYTHTSPTSWSVLVHPGREGGAKEREEERRGSGRLVFRSPVTLLEFLIPPLGQ